MPHAPQGSKYQNRLGTVAMSLIGRVPTAELFVTFSFSSFPLTVHTDQTARSIFTFDDSNDVL
jgi:hypothetical protein